ncbi:MAG: hypothetical protein U9Q81_21085 [Pseudomonadota bacterium]|nr:hypothetical protein [Pseudomonadota bacterium]
MQDGTLEFLQVGFEAEGYESVLKDTRWLLLKRPQNLSEKQEIRLVERQYNLKSVWACLL